MAWWQVWKKKEAPKQNKGTIFLMPGEESAAKTPGITYSIPETGKIISPKAGGGVDIKIVKRPSGGGGGSSGGSSSVLSPSIPSANISELIDQTSMKSSPTSASEVKFIPISGGRDKFETKTFQWKGPITAPGYPVNAGSMSYEEFSDTDTKIKRGSSLQAPKYQGGDLVFFEPTKKQPDFKVENAEDVFIESMIGSRGTGPTLLTVREAPGFWDQYSTFIEDKTKISGTLQFAGQKVSGFLSSKYDLFAGRQESIGKLGELTTNVAPFFIPIVGPTLALGIGGETILTKTGREKVFETSKYWKEEYGVPKIVSTAGQFGFAGGLVFFGGKGLLSDTEKLLGLPTSSTNILGVQRGVGENKAFTDVVFETKTKRLLGTQTDLGVAKISTDILRGEKIIGGRSFTMGSFGERGFTVPGWKTKLGKIKQFSVMESSFSAPAKVTESFKTGIFKVSKEAEGFQSVFGGRVVVGKNLMDKPFAIKKTQFLGAGGGFEIGEGFNIGRMSKIFGRTRIVDEGVILSRQNLGKALKKQGQGVFEGLIIKTKPTPKTFDIVGGGKADSIVNLNKMFTQQIVKGVSGINTAVQLSKSLQSAKPVAIPFNKFTGGSKSLTTQLPKQEANTMAMATSGAMTIPKQKDLQQEFDRVSLGMSTALSTKTRAITRPGTRQKQTDILGAGLVQTPLIKLGDAQDIAIGQIFRGMQTTKQIKKTIPRDAFGSPRYPYSGKGGFFFPPMFPLLPPMFGQEKKQLPSYPRPFKRTPSWAAATLGRISSKPLKGEFTGLIERPLLKPLPKMKFNFGNILGLPRSRKRRKK